MFDEMITLRKLEIFLAFMKAGTMTETAEALQLSAVSVHRAIHSLEEGLKCPLFRQEGRLLLPLPSARVLEERASQLLEGLQDAVTATREISGIYSNQFRLGALYSLTLNTVPKLIAGLKLRKTDLNIELVLDSNAVLFTKLRNFELDVILVSLDKDFQYAEFTVLPLFEDELLLAVPVNSPLASLKAVQLAELSEEKFVSLTPGFATTADSTRAFEHAGFTPNIAMELGDIFSLISMVGAGVGYALLPRRVEAMFDNKIKLIPLINPEEIRQRISMVCLANRERDPRILSCVAECRTYARNQQ